MLFLQSNHSLCSNWFTCSLGRWHKCGIKFKWTCHVSAVLERKFREIHSLTFINEMFWKSNEPLYHGQYEFIHSWFKPSLQLMSIEWLDLIIFMFSLPGPLFFYTAEQTSCLISCLISPLRWCYTGRFAATIFSATQRCNVGTMLYQFETTSQQCCNAVRVLC